jgi:hypothetical protein
LVNTKLKRIQVSPRLPRMFLTFGCGCQERLRGLLDAFEHARSQRHIVTVTGSLNLRGRGLDPRQLVNSSQVQSLSLSFGCGCGFSTQSLEKAIEHLVKSSHAILFRGTVHPSGKVRACRAMSATIDRSIALYPVEATEKAPGRKKAEQSEV